MAFSSLSSTYKDTVSLRTYNRVIDSRYITNNLKVNLALISRGLINSLSIALINSLSRTLINSLNRALINSLSRALISSLSSSSKLDRFNKPLDLNLNKANKAKVLNLNKVNRSRVK